MSLEKVQIFLEPSIFPADIRKSLNSITPIHVVIDRHDLLTQPLKILTRRSCHVDIFERHRSLALPTKAAFGHSGSKSAFSTAKDICVDTSSFGSIHFHIKPTQIPLSSLRLPTLSLIATFTPQSFQALPRRDDSGLARKTILPFHYLPERSSVLGSVPRLLLPSPSTKCKTQGSQGIQKRKAHSNSGAENGKKVKRSGGQGSERTRGSHGENNERENDMPEGGGKKPKKPKTLEERLYSDEKQPFKCPYYYRRPDMFACCRGFQWSSEDIHRRKDHLKTYHRLEPLRYVCRICAQRFEITQKTNFKVHMKANSCYRAEARDYLKGFDESQWELLDPHKEGSPLKGRLEPVDKWEATYQILFPDTKKGGIPKTFQEPEKRDMFRYVRQAMGAESSWTRQEMRCIQLMYDILNVPNDFNAWRKYTAASDDLSIGTRPGNSLPLPFTNRRGTDSAYASLEEVEELNPPVGGDHAAHFSTMSGGNMVRALEPQVYDGPQLANGSNNLLSNPDFFSAPSEIGSVHPSQIGLTSNWTSSNPPGYVLGSQIPPTPQFDPYFDVPTLYPATSEFNDLQMSVPSAPEDHSQMGAIFRDTTALPLQYSSQANAIAFPPMDNTMNFRPP